MTRGLQSDYPVVICYVGIFLRDHWEQVTNRPWWTLHSSHLPDHLKVDEDLIGRLDLDWLPCRMCPTEAWRDSHVVSVDGNGVFVIDTATGRRTEIHREPIGGTQIPMIERPLIRSVEDIEEQVHVTGARSLTQSGRLDYVKMVKKRFGSERFLCAHVGTPYWVALMCHFGFRGMLINLVKRPHLVKGLLERIVAAQKETVRAYAKAGVDGFWIEECLASASEISPRCFETLVLPQTQEIIQEIRSLGKKSIYYACGDVRDRLELIAEAGPDCISLEESKKNFEIDIAWVDEVVAGRSCIFGNLDSIRLLQSGSRDELRWDIRHQIDVGRNHGRFVMSLGSPVTPGTTMSRVREYVDLVRDATRC